MSDTLAETTSAEGSSTRYRGFTPSEISCLVNADVLQQHAGDAAFIWEQRLEAVSSPRYGLLDLTKLDRRLEAHLDGLRISPSEGWACCEQVADDGGGAAFTATVQAWTAGNEARAEWLDSALELGRAAPEAMRGVISGCAWAPWQRVQSVAARWITSGVKDLRYIALSTYVHHRAQPPGSSVQDALVDDDVRLRRRALDAICVFRDERALASAQGSLRDADPTVRWLAARALLVLGRRGSDVAQTLLDLAQAGGALGEAAAGLHASRLNEEQAVAWVRETIQQAPTLRAGIVAAGSAGYGALVEDLIPLLDNDKSARLAGHAFTMITGIDLEYDDLERDSPDAQEDGALEDELDIPVEDPDEELPWPSPDAIMERWAKERSRYTTGERFLGGYVRDPGGLRAVLARGKQPQRIAAAHELAPLRAEGAMYPVKKDACAQARELLGWR